VLGGGAARATHRRSAAPLDTTGTTTAAHARASVGASAPPSAVCPERMKSFLGRRRRRRRQSGGGVGGGGVSVGGVPRRLALLLCAVARVANAQSGNDCPATCLGQTCDYWVQGLWATCDELRYLSTCDCQNCGACAGIAVVTTTTTPTSPSEQNDATVVAALAVLSGLLSLVLIVVLVTVCIRERHSVSGAVRLLRRQRSTSCVSGLRACVRVPGTQLPNATTHFALLMLVPCVSSDDFACLCGGGRTWSWRCAGASSCRPTTTISRKLTASRAGLS
jgi:hypothetical protein